MFWNLIHLVTFLGFGRDIATHLHGRGIYLTRPVENSFHAPIQGGFMFWFIITGLGFLMVGTIWLQKRSQ
jgi:hypothetical protein